MVAVVKVYGSSTAVAATARRWKYCRGSGIGNDGGIGVSCSGGCAGEGINQGVANRLCYDILR